MRVGINSLILTSDLNLNRIQTPHNLFRYLYAEFKFESKFEPL